MEVAIINQEGGFRETWVSWLSEALAQSEESSESFEVIRGYPEPVVF